MRCLIFRKKSFYNSDHLGHTFFVYSRNIIRHSKILTCTWILTKISNIYTLCHASINTIDPDYAQLNFSLIASRSVVVWICKLQASVEGFVDQAQCIFVFINLMSHAIVGLAFKSTAQRVIRTKIIFSCRHRLDIYWNAYCSQLLERSLLSIYTWKNTLNLILHNQILYCQNENIRCGYFADGYSFFQCCDSIFICVRKQVFVSAPSSPFITLIA